MTQSLNESFGGLRLPVHAGDVTTTLAPLEPGRDMLLELFSAALNAELTEAWHKVTQSIPSGQKIDRDKPVADTFPGEPTKQAFQERKPAFPLLALHPTGRGLYEPHLIGIRKLVQPWELHYILGPLDVADNRRLQDICRAASKIIERTTERGAHPGYKGGAQQFGGDDPAVSLFGGIEVTGHEGPGGALVLGDEGSTPYYAITIFLTTVEYTGEDTSQTSVPLQGADYDMGIGGEPAGTIHGLLYANTDHPG